jgi:hypothetical protein
MRRGLVTYLVFVTLLGPCLCCCAAGQLLARTGACCKKNAKNCCGRAAECAATCQTPCGSQPSNPRGAPDCRCEFCLSLASAVAVRPLDLHQVEFEKELKGLPIEVPAVVAPAPAGFVLPAAWAESAALPFVTSHDLLFAFHILRC